jgi:hypothetical protein
MRRIRVGVIDEHQHAKWREWRFDIGQRRERATDHGGIGTGGSGRFATDG